ncbi:hypothetical protein MUP01_02825 [Candidatus Bathyarchaeota archaeon]|nr:hypothetical protein [Candidatus Bathyarchaeota archaeon]
MKGKKLSRDKIIQTLVGVLEPLEYVHAFWEGGAAAFNRVDEWSDIDVYVVIDDGRVDAAFGVVEKTLKSLSPIRQKYSVPQPGWQGVHQAFYRLQDTNEHLIIDLAILELSCPTKFLEPEIHGNNVFYFNKSEVVKFSPLDRDAFVEKICARVERLHTRSVMFNNFVQKEINRGNYLEAIDLYYNVTLATLVEALRIKHNPFHYDFKMRYVHYELPQRLIEKLERLFFIKDKKAIYEKYREASKWFNHVLREINRKRIESLVKDSK